MGLVVAGCAGADRDTARTGGGSTPSPGRTELTIAVTETRGGQPTTWTLTCDPPGGTHPDPAAACAALDAGDAAFAPVSADVACTEIYGGDQTARVTGNWRGEPVDATFSRANGCEIDRWDQLRDLLHVAGGVTPAG